MPFHSNTRLYLSLAVEDGALKAQCSTVTSSEMPHTSSLVVVGPARRQGGFCVLAPADGAGGGSAAPSRKHSNALGAADAPHAAAFLSGACHGQCCKGSQVMVPADGAAGGSAAPPRKRSKASAQAVPNEQLQQQQQSQQEAYDQARLAQVSMRQTGTQPAPVTCTHSSCLASDIGLPKDACSMSSFMQAARTLVCCCLCLI